MKMERKYRHVNLAAGSFDKGPQCSQADSSAGSPGRAGASINTAVGHPQQVIPTSEEDRSPCGELTVGLPEMDGDVSEADISGYSSSDEEYTIAHVRRMFKETEPNRNDPPMSANIACFPTEMNPRDVGGLEEDDEEDDEQVVREGDEASGSSCMMQFPEVRWCLKDMEKFHVAYKEMFSEPPDDCTPMLYFKQLCDSEMFSNFAEQTNLYSCEKTGKSIDTNEQEMEQFIGINIMSGLMCMPSFKQYWSQGTRYHPIADVMSQDRFYSLRNHFHVSDNSKIGNSAHDKLFKIRPFVDKLRRNMQALRLEEKLTIDKFFIPFKGKYSRKDYVANNPHKLGTKVFALAGTSGILYDFEIYLGEADIFEESALGIGGDVVLRLTESVPGDCNIKLFVDHCFVSYSLAVALKQRGILMAGTVKMSNVPCNSFKRDAELKKERGSLDYRTDMDSNITFVRWYDNKCTTTISSFVGVHPITNVRRWSVTDKRHVGVPRPAMVKAYEESVGGVELHDMLVTCHRMNFKTKRYYLRIVFHLIDVCVVNAWLLYRRDLKQKGDTKYMTLIKFRSQVAFGLMTAGVEQSATKRDDGTDVKRKWFAPRPVADVRFDGIGHWAEPMNPKQRCKLCVAAYSRVKCDKCDVYLCLNKNKNCFKKFHTST